MQQLKKMGSIADLLGKIPGMSRLMGKEQVDESEFKYMEAVILSMTRKERRNPKIINGSRRRRIAEGSGTQVQDVNRLLKDFEQTRKMMKDMMKGKGFLGGKGLKGRLPKGMGPLPGM